MSVQLSSYTCLCLSDSLKCVQLLDTQLSQLFICPKFSSIHLYIRPSVSNCLTLSQLSVPNVQAIQLPTSTICHEVMEILANKVTKSLINKLNSIVLYSSEEQVCLTSSVSKCVHQSWYYQLSILISAHLCPILWSMTNCWMLNCLNCLMSFQVLSVSNRSPIGYSSVSALFYLPNFQMSPTVQLFICPCVFNSL